MNKNDHRIIGAIRNPLTLIALFVLLIEVIAAITMTNNVLTESQRWWFVVFCTVFPVFVFIVFSCIVIWRPKHLYGPKDFKDETLFLKDKIEKDIDEVIVMGAESDAGSDAGSVREKIRETIARADRVAIEQLEAQYKLHFEREQRSKTGLYIFDAVAKEKGQTYRVEVKYCPAPYFKERLVDTLAKFFQASNDGAINIVAIVSPSRYPTEVKDQFISEIKKLYPAAKVHFYSLEDS